MTYKHLTAMDPAQEVENDLLELLKPMNSVIDRGDSAVQLFYRDTTIFLTGGTGFIGRLLLEKLLRSCDLKKVYLLMRPKKGQTIQQRLTAILNDTVYDDVRKKKPQFADKIVPVDGDVAELGLGLSYENWTLLTEEVNVIFHVAATVRFDEPIKVATLINVRGTREALQLAKECKHFKCYNHTSTAFAHATKNWFDKDVEEKFYPCPIPADVMIRMVETVDDDRLNAITASLIEGWPNTYTFTKAIAEEVIRTSGLNVPICIVKPPVVTSTYLEPVPGWIDLNTCFSSPVGYILGSGLGLMHTLIIDKDFLTCYAPVDYVSNAIIAASWDTVERRSIGNGEPDVAIYTISSSGRGYTWRFFGDWFRSDEIARLATPKSVWYGWAIETDNNFLYWLLTWLFHYIPAYVIDGLLDVLRVRPEGIPRLSKIYKKLYKITKVYQYFVTHNWYFKDDNVKAMIKRMSPEDRLIYNCDITTIDFKKLLKAYCIGMRKYIVKDGLRGSDYGYMKQKYVFKYANVIFMAVYGYIIYKIFHMIYILFASMAQFIFN